MIAHNFAHEPGATCVASRRETSEHLRGKDFLLTGFRARELRAETEVPFEIFTSEEDRRADVVVWGPNSGKPIAFEVQHTMLELKDIMRRTQGYAAGQIPVLWINLMKPHRVENRFRVAGTNITIVRKYTTYAWERWVHDFGDEGGTNSKVKRGHLWFLDPKDGLMWRGSFLNHYLYQEGSEYYDSGGEFQSHPGGWYVSERYSTLVLEGPFAVKNLKIKLHHRRARKQGAYRYPAGPAVWMLAPTDDEKEGPRRPPIRMHRETFVNGVELMPRPQMLRDGEWIDIGRERAGAPVPNAMQEEQRPNL